MAKISPADNVSKMHRLRATERGDTIWTPGINKVISDYDYTLRKFHHTSFFDERINIVYTNLKILAKLLIDLIYKCLGDTHSFYVIGI